MATGKVRKQSQALALRMAMDHIAFLKKRENELIAEMQAAKAKFRASVRETRERRVRYREAQSQWLGIYRVREAMERIEEAEGHELDGETTDRVSAMLLHVLRNAPVEGATVAQLASVLSEVKKSTISATLYNMKKRGDVEHSEVTGRYALPHRTGPTGPTGPTRGGHPAFEVMRTPK
jgi:hypothetical protein